LASASDVVWVGCIAVSRLMSRYATDVALGDGDGLDNAYGGSRAATSEMAFFAAREALDYLEPIKRQFSRGI
jgi:hypothetical protein